jgi:hypothetical protein
MGGKGKDVYQVVDEILSMSESEAEKATTQLIHPYPNTYTFSKALGEVILQREVYAPPPASFHHDDDRPLFNLSSSSSSRRSSSSNDEREEERRDRSSEHEQEKGSHSSPPSPSSLRLKKSDLKSKANKSVNAHTTSSSSPPSTSTATSTERTGNVNAAPHSPSTSSRTLPPLSVPVLIIRPSIVGCAAQYPLPGWVDSLIGANGLLLAEGIGAMHTMRGRGELVVDFIPVDFVANAILGASALTLRRNLRFPVPLFPSTSTISTQQQQQQHQQHQHQHQHQHQQQRQQQVPSPTTTDVVHNVVLWSSDTSTSTSSTATISMTSPLNSADQYRPQAKQITVYHIASSAKNPCLWDWPRTIVWGYFQRQPPRKMVGRPFVFWAAGPLKHFILHCLLHVLPAAIIDTTRLVRGKRAKMVSATRKLNKAISSLAFFTTNQWLFACDNIDQLIEELDPIDRQLFNFDVRTIDWETYFITYSQGIKRFLLKEGPPRTVEDEGVAPALRSRL